MTPPTYNQALLEMASQSLAELARTGAQKAGKRTPAQESHFLCTWMADSLKEKRFSRLVMEDLKAWVQLGRTLGAGADLKGLLERIIRQYERAMAEPTGLGGRLAALLAELEAAGWLVLTSSEVNAKLRLQSGGQPSLIISASEYQGHIEAGELTRSLTLYVRGDEARLAQAAFSHGLLLSQGNKKTTLVKHHKAYRLVPGNAQPALALLIGS
ncbi:DUF2913 family protein [Aeromonas caviae]|uniref:DUF2913 family protein n=1 Tax=Aeromonas TaxID=642 RepID=UPI000CD00565|nr:MULTISPECIES: DUF2913 family protein [Aeromonas]AUT40356.1 hypothetical protein C2U30_00610 [Aeromonas sp. ASNIH5]MBL0549146.1 DUF2913 family protein [Aeromonas caviae]MDH0351484.1 DUF2913 family protein [Aeromonas caviae]MDH0474698.1 DUF2913 family protein [Aeromonas caviae]MDX7821936.1 DUF2913 family protein [Aeromonas caviae]